MFIKKILFSPVIAAKWIKALDAASSENYNLASKILDEIDEYSSGINVEYHLLKMHVLFALGRNSEAISNKNIGLALLDSSSRYNPDEKFYLKCYVLRLERSIFLDSEKASIDKSLKEVCLSYDLHKVREALRLSFPLNN